MLPCRGHVNHNPANQRYLELVCERKEEQNVLGLAGYDWEEELKARKRKAQGFNPGIIATKKRRPEWAQAYELAVYFNVNHQDET